MIEVNNLFTYNENSYLQEGNMSIDEAIKEFGSQAKLCSALNIHRQSIRQWRKQGYVPHKHQIKIQQLTNGRLIADLKKEAG